MKNLLNYLDDYFEDNIDKTLSNKKFKYKNMFDDDIDECDQHKKSCKYSTKHKRNKNK